MAIREGSNKSPEKPSKRQAEANENGHLFSPRFRSVAAMAGWDEEALLIASLIVEDTPDRQIKHNKQSDLHGFKTPPSNSRRKRKAQRRSPASIPITVLDLEENGSKPKQESEKTDKKTSVNEVVVENRDCDEMNTKGNDVSISGLGIACLDRLREELSCAICLEICYEPSTTPCGHSFCKKCLHSAADRCGKKCPKCRQLIRCNSRYSTVNTVLWNTIQLLFPKEVEARKANDPSTSDNNELKRETQSRRNRSLRTQNRAVLALNSSPESENRRNHSLRHRSSRPSGGTSSRQQQHRFSTRRALPSQDEDAALALRLQREEFMEAFRAPDEPSRDPSFAVARANLRAMASRAVNIRIRGRRE
ncbi:zinc finger (C3HC4-type RING finger) family protein [Striga asiatica]|uniref:RING-type E3 ubiquitin transferase n=1 Tax=Striga asiatica TaxID=4170 RepID=A0A5A7PA28_STRAF|nr:zinc finger (C3HC4-type RING finger) family protein [Striga asiatica]